DSGGQSKVEETRDYSNTADAKNADKRVMQ
ncbi:hypothetical protein, partial [Salmonella enterica]